MVTPNEPDPDSSGPGTDGISPARQLLISAEANGRKPNNSGGGLDNQNRPRGKRKSTIMFIKAYDHKGEDANAFVEQEV
jgi:hypothetical protein